MPGKLLIICPYPVGKAPSQRLKYEQYLSAFAEEGWEVTIEPFITEKFWAIIYKKGFLIKKAFYSLLGYLKRLGLLFRIPAYDVVYIHLWTTPFGPPIFEALICSLAKYVVYDIDDLVYLKDVKSNAHPIVDFIKGRRKPIYLMKKANHVITCTPYLDSFVKKFNSNTTDISSTVDTEKYKVLKSHCTSSKVTIGWSGSISTSKYLYLLTEVFQKLAMKYEFKLLVMGDKGFRIEGVDVEAVDWEESYEMQILQSFDIGVYPLPNEEWVYGKSGLKAIQYMALGIPTVASAIGANFRVIDDGISGFLVSTTEEWLEKLSLLIENQGLRQQIGMNARKKVEEKFSVKVNSSTYLKVIEGLSANA